MYGHGEVKLLCQRPPCRRSGLQEELLVDFSGVPVSSYERGFLP